MVRFFSHLPSICRIFVGDSLISTKVSIVETRRGIERWGSFSLEGSLLVSVSVSLYVSYYSLLLVVLQGSTTIISVVVRIFYF